MNELKPLSIKPSSTRFIIHKFFWRLGYNLVGLIGRAIPNKFKKAKHVVCKHNSLSRFLFGGMPDFILYQIFTYVVFLRAKFNNRLKRRLNDAKNGPFPVDQQKIEFDSTGIVRIAQERIESAEQFLTEIFASIESLKNNNSSTVRLTDFYYYCHSPHIFFLENISDKLLNDLSSFIKSTGIDDFLLGHYKSGYEICNVRAWKSLSFSDNGGYHFDNLPPGFIKIMVFTGDSKTNFLLSGKNGAFEYKNRLTGETHKLTGYLPTAIIDTSNLEHRAGTIADGHTRKAIELTVRPVDYNGQARYLEPGFCAGHPVNPFHIGSYEKAKNLRLSGFIGFSKSV